MKQRTLQVITSLLLIITLTMANFFMLCVNVVSYANEIINLEKATNHKNVEFMAYFKDEKGNKSDSLDAYTNASDLKIYFQVSVNQEGYFNGDILLNNANFIFKEDIVSDVVNEIEDNKIHLNQIKAGETKEIEVGIDLLEKEQFDLNFIDLESSILIQGIYKDSTQKDISINSERNINLNLISPYTDAEETIILSQEVITNKILNYNGEDKRIIQLEIKSGLNGNLYPIKQTSIDINAPKISDTYPESVLVNSNYDLATNGESLTQDNWNYNAETGIININIENEANNNKVSWVKNTQDRFIITYVFDKDLEINDEKSIINSKINLYDKNNSVFETMNEMTLDKTEKNTIIKTEMYQNETSIYKGKIYAGISREITYTTVLSVNLSGVASEINVVENNQLVNEKEISSTYNKTVLNKNNIQNILGIEGILTIVNGKTNEKIATVSNETETDENGNIVVSYPENVTEIIIKTTAPKNVGNITIQNTKIIGKISKNDAKSAKEIVSKLTGNYVSNSNTIELPEVNSSIELKETQTSAYLELNKTELSTMSTNNIEMRVILKSRDESNELYKNPTIRIQLPSKIENVDITSINLVYEKELEIKDAKLIDGNTIEIKLNGEQTQYKEEAIDGAIIIINANLTTSKKLPSSSEKIFLAYTNDNVINYENDAKIGQTEKQIDLISYAGVVTINKVPEYNTEIINNEETDKTVTIDIQSSENKEIKIENEIINNNENKITDVKILGTLPTMNSVENVNNMNTSINKAISVDGISQDRVKVYYSENANATEDLKNAQNGWTETITDVKNVKKYLVVGNELDVTEGLNISYSINTPDNLEYNLNAQEDYTVYYTSLSAEEQLDVSPITLSTPKGAVIETELKALVAGQEKNEVKENGVLRYIVNISNTGSEEVSNIKVLAKVPDGTVYVNTDKLNNEVDLDELVFEDENKKDVEFNIEKLLPGEVATRYYEVKVNSGMAGKELANTVTTQYGDVTKTSNGTKISIVEGNLELKLVSADAINSILSSGYQYRYVLYITNTSDKDIKNIKATINANDIVNITEMYYINNNMANIVDNTNVIEINKIAAGETIEIAISAGVKPFKDNGEKQVSITATCIENDNEYDSNEINLIAKSNLVLSMTATSENSGGYVKAGDIIKYKIIIKNEGTERANIVNLKNWIPNDVTLVKVIRNGVELSSDNYLLKIDENKNQKVLNIEEDSIAAGESIEYQVEVIVNLLYGNTEPIELISEYVLKADGLEVDSVKIQHVLQPEVVIPDDDDDEGEENGNTPGSDTEVDGKKIISGIAWIDENENGQRENNEKVMEGIVVKLLDVTTNEFVKDSNGNILATTTSATGFYNFNELEKGQYLVIFEYDTTKYGLTTFEKEGISNDVNSNVITKRININGIETKVAATEILTIENDNIPNVNIGLIVAKKYDLQLDKYISKVTIQNNKTVTKEYENQTLVKQEIDAKQVNSTMVVVEYTIKVTNNGDVTAYVKKIADYLSVDYKFNSELNKDWYQSGNDLYCTSLANEKLEPGESKEVKLTVIKEMTENNTGLINNTAEIVDSYNELGLTDMNSTEGNKVKGENDMGSADLIISIRTGQVVMTVSLIILTIVMLGIAILIIRKIINNRRIM